jgi:hypothetical protein
MSIIENEEETCPGCGQALRVDVIHSINGHRRPDLRAAILDDTLQRARCPHCEATFRVAPRFSYVDATRGEWILVEPASGLAEWKDLEEAAAEIFDRTYGPRAPALAREVGEMLQPRVTFGWPALREKLLCSQLGLDDVSLEVVKATILREGGELPLGDDVELRLVGADADALTLAWLDAGTGAPIEELIVPRARLRDAASADFEPLRDALTVGSFVDLHRVLVPVA